MFQGKCSLCNGRILPTIPSFKFWDRESMKFERLSQIKDARIDKKQSSFPPEQKSNHYRKCVQFSDMKFIFTKKCFYIASTVIVIIFFNYFSRKMRKQNSKILQNIKKKKTWYILKKKTIHVIYICIINAFLCLFIWILYSV